MQVCVHMWSTQQCVLVSPDQFTQSPCFQFLMTVEMRISHVVSVLRLLLFSVH